MIIEARTEGEQMVYTVERFLEKNGAQVSEQEADDTHKLISALKSSLNSGNKDLIHKSIDELNEFTRPFAERLMNTAISSAMKGKAIE
jgi:molecular chaperone HscA